MMFSDRKDPCLWRAALLYYTSYKAAFMSFADLFTDLGRFVKDPYTRWDYCLRAKRGMTDTSRPGMSAATGSVARIGGTIENCHVCLNKNCS